jgi:hypothetical protein
MRERSHLCQEKPPGQSMKAKEQVDEEQDEQLVDRSNYDSFLYSFDVDP